MSDSSLLIAGLAFLMPLGYGLMALAGLTEERARDAALGLLAALGLASAGYLAVGFALQYGGAGLVYNQPGLEELVWEWSALGPTWGTGWGMAGLAGWGLTGAAATPGAYALAFANLPWVTTAALVPLVSLRGRVPAWAAGMLGLLVGAGLYPLAGNWIWGGGWLANLGSNLGLGHGFVDAGGAGLVHLLGAATALAGILVFLPRIPRPADRHAPVPLPPVHLPLLAVFGAGAVLAGGLAWLVSNPLLDRRSLDLSLAALNGVLAVAGGGFVPLVYTWFVTGRADPLMAVRGFASGSIVGAGIAFFVPPWAALAAGAAVGFLMPLAVFFIERVLRLDDPTAAITVHGMGGALALLAVSLLADGRSGVAWNGIGADAYLGVTRQGVSGLWAAAGFQPDWPAQFQAQAVGVAALALFGFFVAWICVAPPAVVLHVLRVRLATLAHPARDRGASVPGVPASPEAWPVEAEVEQPLPEHADAPEATAITATLCDDEASPVLAAANTNFAVLDAARGLSQDESEPRAEAVPPEGDGQGSA